MMVGVSRIWRVCRMPETSPKPFRLFFPQPCEGGIMCCRLQEIGLSWVK